jgi:1-deoxy-D-xylulose-5-phosphate synthase
MAAIDEPTLRAALEFMRTRDEGPSALRYPRDDVPEPRAAEAPPYRLGRADLLAGGDDLAILAYGFPANHALAAREALAAEGISVAVYDARFAKPVDLELVRSLVKSRVPVLTVEDHHVTGGFGSSVLDACNDNGLPTDDVHRLGLPDRWIGHGSRAGQQVEAGIDAAGIAARVREILAVKKVRPMRRYAASRGGERSSSAVRRLLQLTKR